MTAVYRRAAGNDNPAEQWDRTRQPNNGHKKTDAWASVFHYPARRPDYREAAFSDRYLATPSGEAVMPFLPFSH